MTLIAHTSFCNPAHRCAPSPLPLRHIFFKSCSRSPDFLVRSATFSAPAHMLYRVLTCDIKYQFGARAPGFKFERRGVEKSLWNLLLIIYTPTNFPLLCTVIVSSLEKYNMYIDWLRVNLGYRYAINKVIYIVQSWFCVSQGRDFHSRSS